ncbi:peroxidase isoform X1 [Lucilia cuprina]|uniref:peroxidase isoform X1 n=2 Tax=Lucilia cuprina TaxID=7375 RepID=UPI001F063420|nr:peroxidase isoform X1 [Lucilia cuprina]
MNFCAYRLILLILTIITEAKLSHQFKCPYSHWNDPGTLSVEALTALAARNTLAELGMKDLMPGHNSQLNILKPVPESGLSTMAIESFLQNSFRPNNIKKDVFGGIYGDQTLDNLYNSYLGAMKTAELECAVPPISCFNDTSNYYFRTYDGSCNNFQFPGYGIAKSRYSRILRPKYGDGQYAPSKSTAGHALPNPRVLSLSLYGEDTLSDSYRTLLTMQFGQFVAHDISQLYSEGLPDDCCANPKHKMCYSIPLHPFGPIAMTSGKTCLSFARSLSDKDIACAPSGLPYAEKITTTTAFLDLSSVYGNSLEQNIKVRQYKGGLLKTSLYNSKQFLPIQSSSSRECPANNEQCYSIPDNRNQFTPIIAVLQTIFVREHNRLAKILSQINPHYSDERIFQVARKINIAQYQKITFYDWLPLILGPMYSLANRLIYSISPYEYVNDYDRNLDPAPFAEYAASAFRYIHQSIPGWFSMVSSGRNSNQTMRLSDYFDRQDSMKLLMEGNNFDSLIRGLATQLEKRADGNVDREIKHHFDRKFFDEFGTDLKAIDIQRGRDYGLPSYNDYREQCGLARAYQWSDFINEISEEKIELLKKFYSSPNDIDLTIGGSYENHSGDSMLGPTFQCIIGKQFFKIRAADRFFYEHEDKNSGFTRDQLAAIRKISFASIFCANGNNLQCIQPNVFIFPNHQNNLINCKAFPQLDLRLWKDDVRY